VGLEVVKYIMLLEVTVGSVVNLSLRYPSAVSASFKVYSHPAEVKVPCCTLEHADVEELVREVMAVQPLLY
jgi:hypothetical protein